MHRLLPLAQEVRECFEGTADAEAIEACDALVRLFGSLPALPPEETKRETRKIRPPKRFEPDASPKKAPSSTVSVASAASVKSAASSVFRKPKLGRPPKPKSSASKSSRDSSQERKPRPDESFVSVKSVSDDPKAQKRNRKGETRLHAACTRSKIEEVRELLREGSDPNTKDFAGWTPLLEAVGNGSAEIVELLLRHGAHPNTPGPMNNSPLHEAVKSKRPDVIELLMESGADVNSKNSSGETPFRLADDDIKAILIEPDASPRMPNISSAFDSVSDSVVKIYSSLRPENASKLKRLMENHSNVAATPKLIKTTTFMVTDAVNDYEGCPANIDALTAIVLGVPIVNAGWLSVSDDVSLAPPTDFQVPSVGGVCGSLERSRINALTLFPPLFDGCHFYFLDLNAMYEIGSNLKVNKEILSDLVRAGGGVVLKREPDPEGIPEKEQMVPYHGRKGSALENCSHYIIYRCKPKCAYNMKHLKTLPVGWLIDCIQHFQLLDPIP